jgi:hypothetical protein
MTLRAKLLTSRAAAANKLGTQHIVVVLVFTIIAVSSN